MLEKTRVFGKVVRDKREILLQKYQCLRHGKRVPDILARLTFRYHMRPDCFLLLVPMLSSLGSFTVYTYYEGTDKTSSNIHLYPTNFTLARLELSNFDD